MDFTVMYGDKKMTRKKHIRQKRERLRKKRKKERLLIKEVWFPDGVWEHIRSYMPIWKYPFNKVMEELPKIERSVFRIEYWRELPILKKNIYMYAGVAKFGGIEWSNKMYMVKEIHDYPLSVRPKPDAYRPPYGFSRENSENDSMEFPHTIYTYYLAAGQDLVALGIKPPTIQ